MGLGGRKRDRRRVVFQRVPWTIYAQTHNPYAAAHGQDGKLPFRPIRFTPRLIERNGGGVCLSVREPCSSRAGASLTVVESSRQTSEYGAQQEKKGEKEFFI